jgi:hypothetical protein
MVNGNEGHMATIDGRIASVSTHEWLGMGIPFRRKRYQKSNLSLGFGLLVAVEHYALAVNISSGVMECVSGHWSTNLKVAAWPSREDILRFSTRPGCSAETKSNGVGGEILPLSQDAR